NFLLNRTPKASIDLLPNIDQKTNHILQLLHQKIDISRREEIKELRETMAIRKNIYQMNKSAYYPSLNGFLDLGSQAENWQFNHQSRYYMAGIQLEIPLFEGNRNKNKIRKSKLAIQNEQLKIDRTVRRLRLSNNISL